MSGESLVGVVPAAGEGTRLRPHTTDTPKALVEVAGKPILEHVFETLLDCGVSSLVVVVGYRAGQIVDRFGESYAGHPITYVHQRERRGLGDAIYRVESVVDGPFVVLNGDNVVGGAVTAPLDRFADDDVDAVVAVERADRETATKTGVVTVEDGVVTSIVEKPADPPSTLVTTGLYVFPDAIFDALSLTRPSDRGELELTDAIGVLVSAGLTVAAVEIDAERVNVNTPADLERAATLVTK